MLIGYTSLKIFSYPMFGFDFASWHNDCTQQEATDQQKTLWKLCFVYKASVLAARHDEILSYKHLCYLIVN